MLRNMLFVLLVLFAAVKFVPPCTLPFDTIKHKHPIDDTCGISGIGGGNEKLLQNAAKNNFCATGVAALTSFATLIHKQRQVEAPPPGGLGPDYHEPASRTTLRTLGEGSRISIIAFIKEAHFADTGSGEDVNCKGKGADNNDIHIALVEHIADPECTSVTAEMSPHFRPLIWERANPDPASTPTKPKPPIPLLNTIKRPVLIIGQLFFDASHHPCKNGTPGKDDPARASSWEVHPVYDIKVCKHDTIATCRENVAADWEDLGAVIH